MRNILFFTLFITYVLSLRPIDEHSVVDIQHTGYRGDLLVATVTAAVRGLLFFGRAMELGFAKATPRGHTIASFPLLAREPLVTHGRNVTVGRRSVGPGSGTISRAHFSQWSSPSEQPQS